MSAERATRASRARRAARQALVALLLAGCGHWAAPDPTLARMVDQPRGDPFTPSAAFADGATMQAPPAGTVAREDVTDPLRGRGIAGDGGYAAHAPGAVTMARLRRGQDRYQVFCAPCHGLRGDGSGPVADDLVAVRPRDLHLAAVREQLDGRLFRTIGEGFGLMPSYAAQLEIDDRWAVVLYLRALQLSRGAAIADLPPAIGAEARERLP